ncbi:MAG: hypothetical protein J6Y45_08295, partial [Bacteroidales bacterium]|nr:hypothetical protein [Bacteroidales bacterium]
MKFRLAAVAALFCCLACVEINTELGANLVPVDQTYSIYPKDALLPSGSISMKMTDSLSGYSQTRITIGAVRDGKYGLSTRSCALTLVPVLDTLDFGNLSAVKVQRFHFAAVMDTVSVISDDQRHIIQNVKVHA